MPAWLTTVINLATTYGPWVVTVAAFAAAGLPQAAPNTPWWYVRKVIDWAAANFGNAKNLQAPKP